MARWSDPPVRRGDLLYVPSARHLSCRGRAVVLRPAMDVVLRQLMRPGTAVTRYEALVAALDALPAGGCGTMSALRAAVFALRHHLRALGSEADIRVGYRLVAAGGAGRGGTEKKGSASFLKKRSKKLLPIGSGVWTISDPDR